MSGISPLISVRNELEKTSPSQFGGADEVLDDLNEVIRTVRQCADELIAVHETTGIDVYDRVPGWLGVIRLAYPDWADESSPCYGKHYR